MHKETKRTGDALYCISKKVNEIRIESIEKAESLDPNTQTEICISDHLIWKWKVYNMILGNETLDVGDVGNHHTCRLGKWIKHSDIQDIKLTKLIEEIDDPHEKLHEYAKEAIVAYNRGNVSEAEAMLEKMDHVSKEVIRILDEMRNTVL